MAQRKNEEAVGMFNAEALSYRKASILTALGIKKSGFFTPFAYADAVSPDTQPYDAVERLLAGQSGDFEARLADFETTLPAFKQAVAHGDVPYEEGGMFPKLDALAAYHLVRQLKPNRIVEIGSGASTHIMSRALRDNGQSQLQEGQLQEGQLRCIDPQPRRSIEATGAEIEYRTLAEDDAELVTDFKANDILFIDSSHVMLPGMDVDIQFNRMFPALPRGAIVHVHDIFLPDPYPASWGKRMYSEQNALIGWLVSGFFEVLFPAYYVATRLEDELHHAIGDLMPTSPSKNAGSMWLRRC
ncbi:MAG: class I SAM-dependent methyltransferase [Pseudomonadota bacterium]